MDEKSARANDIRVRGRSLKGYVYLSLAIVFASYSNLMLKYQINHQPNVPDGLSLISFFMRLVFTNVWVISCGVGLFLAAICWVGAISRFDLSVAVPFASLNFAIVTILSFLLLNEPFNWYKGLGVLMICAGVIIVGKGS
jgi:drug/metabolite transporter (DMT)-like permease